MQYLKSTFLPARIGSLHGLLYLIQGCLLSNTVIGGISEELQILLPIAVEYVQCNINMCNKWDFCLCEKKTRASFNRLCYSSILKQSQEHTLLVWALAFYLIENLDETHFEQNFTEIILQAALSQLLDDDITFYIHNAILKGLERIVIVKKTIFDKLNKHILNLALEKIKNPNPNIALPGLQLLISYMYTGACYLI